MAVEVRVPSMLQKFTDGEKLVQVESESVGQLLHSLEANYPGIGHQLLEDGQLRRFVNIYLNDEDIRFLDGMDTSLADGDVLAILPALAGGDHSNPGGSPLVVTAAPVRYQSLLDTIGDTPLVRLQRMSPSPDVSIWVKLEGQNPTGSVKDRIAKAMIDAAHADGSLQPGQTILEPTSGNTGLAIALIGRLSGHPVRCVMPESVSVERRDLLRFFGAEVILSPGETGSNGAVRMAKEIYAQDPSVFMPMQYENAANPGAHYETTGPEILRDCPELTHFVAGLGTGGTLTGVGRYLKEQRPDVRIVAAAPHPGDLVQGLRSLDEGYIPPVLDESVLDARIMVDSRTSFAVVKQLLEDEGIFAGISCGAAVRAALRMAERLESGHIVVLLADGGWKYLSTGLWSRDYEDIAGDEEIEGKIWW